MNEKKKNKRPAEENITYFNNKSATYGLNLPKGKSY